MLSSGRTQLAKIAETYGEVCECSRSPPLLSAAVLQSSSASCDGLRLESLGKRQRAGEKQVFRLRCGTMTGLGPRGLFEGVARALLKAKLKTSERGPPQLLVKGIQSSDRRARHWGVSGLLSAWSMQGILPNSTASSAGVERALGV